MTKKKTPEPTEPGSGTATAPRSRGKMPWLNRMEPHIAKLRAFAVAELEKTREDKSAGLSELREAMQFVEDVESHPSWKPVE